MPNVLIDTNILVYAYDRGEHAKQQQAIRLLESLHLAGAGRLSVQCLGEFFRATTKGPQPILTVEQAREQAELLAFTWPVLELTPLIVLEAMRGVVEHQMAYWDAQIWAAARLNQVSLVLSEDFSDGTLVDGVRFLNPLAPSFDLARVLALRDTGPA